MRLQVDWNEKKKTEEKLTSKITGDWLQGEGLADEQSNYRKLFCL